MKNKKAMSAGSWAALFILADKVVCFLEHLEEAGAIKYVCDECPACDLCQQGIKNGAGCPDDSCVRVIAGWALIEVEND